MFRLLLIVKNEVKTLEFGQALVTLLKRAGLKGYAVTAGDLSEEMLTVADEKSPNRTRGADARFFMGKIRSTFRSRRI